MVVVPEITSCSRKVVLLVEDDAPTRQAVARYLQLHDFDVDQASTCEEAMRAARSRAPDVVIVDHVLPDGTSAVLIPALRAVHPSVPVVLLTGYGTIEMAVHAVRSGAHDVLPKPLPLHALLQHVRRTLETTSPSHKTSRIIPAVHARGEGPPDPAEELIGESTPMVRLHDQLRAMRDADCSVLILGETGTGKGVVARALHRLGRRASGPFRDVNCATLTRELAQSELFGHARGAFTGAVSAKEGLFEAAHGGTLFLDEIGDIDVSVQPKLLTALEDRRVRRVGEVQDRVVDVRLLAATHHDLLRATRDRAFRSDLFYRISTLRIDIPPLRERGTDVVLLARTFLAGASARAGRPLRLAACAERALVRHRWPGNVRELRNVIDRAVLLSPGEWVLEGAILLDRDQGAEPPSDVSSTVPGTLADMEKRHVAEALLAEGGDVGRAARRLGIARSTLYAKIRIFGIDPAASRRSAGGRR